LSIRRNKDIDLAQDASGIQRNLQIQSRFILTVSHVHRLPGGDSAQQIIGKRF
jgi:hypothetical protein